VLPPFLFGFKRRDLSPSRRVHMRHRPPVTEDDKISWQMTPSRRLRDVSDHERIINVDELCWRGDSDGRRPWATPGTQNTRLDIQGNEKDLFTVIAAITTRA
jgi:hypothetical protein